MRIEGVKKLLKQFDKMPKAVGRNLVKSVHLNTEQAARRARSLVPVDRGNLKKGIFTQYQGKGYFGSVEAAQFTKKDQTKASAVEFGRTAGDRGTTTAHPYIQLAQKLQKPKFDRSMKSAVTRGLKEATRG